MHRRVHDVDAHLAEDAHDQGGDECRAEASHLEAARQTIRDLEQDGIYDPVRDQRQQEPNAEGGETEHVEEKRTQQEIDDAENGGHDDGVAEASHVEPRNEPGREPERQGEDEPL